MDEQHIDGNGIAGLLGEIAGAEMTAVRRTCPSCGDRRSIGEHRAYRSARMVFASCPPATSRSFTSSTNGVGPQT